jgi:hypothetical protein
VSNVHRHPAPEEMGDFRPDDFALVLKHLPENCPVVGGQAVSWWAERFDVTGPNGLPVTSSDIDFWGERNDLELLAKRLNLKAFFPHEYEMTVWVGAVQLIIKGKKSIAEFLHTIPGLDIPDSEKASVAQEFRAAGFNRTIRVLTPVSLIPEKLHCLRHFDQEHRQDEFHLRICLLTARQFLAEFLAQGNIRFVLSNIERLISFHRFKPYRRLEAALGFNLLEAVPVDEMRLTAQEQKLPPEGAQRLCRFLDQRWPQVLNESETAETDTA